MKCFIVLLAVVAACQCRSVVPTEEVEGYTVYGAYGKHVYLSKPYGPHNERYIQIFGNEYFPDKKIEISYPFSEVFAKIFSTYTAPGSFDVEQYEKLLKTLEKYVEKGEVSPVVYEFLKSYDLFAPFEQQSEFVDKYQYQHGFPYSQYGKFFGQYPYGQYYGKQFGGYPWAQYFGKYQYGYPQYGQYGKYFNEYSPFFAKYFKNSPFYYQYLKNFAKYGSGYGYTGQQYSGPYKYDSQYQGPYNYESEFYGPSYNYYSKYFTPSKYETQQYQYGPYNYDSEFYGPYNYPYNYQSEYYPYQYGKYYGQENQVGYGYQGGYEGLYNYPYYQYKGFGKY